MSECIAKDKSSRACGGWKCCSSIYIVVEGCCTNAFTGVVGWLVVVGGEADRLTD